MENIEKNIIQKYKKEYLAFALITIGGFMSMGYQFFKSMEMSVIGIVLLLFSAYLLKDW
jgi:hypothetical protein